MPIKVGDQVRVLNRNMAGKLVYEGTATVTYLFGVAEGRHEGMNFIHAAVQFPGDGETDVKRTIELDAQRGTLEEMKERYGIED